MARTRNLKPGFFQNDELAECSPFARLLFAGLWTIADREGRLEYKEKKIKAALFPYDAVAVPELVAELHGKKLLAVYEVDNVPYIAIPKFTKHQRPHPKEPASVLPQPPCEQKTCDKAVERNGEPCKETAVCALPSSNPLILAASHPDPLDQDGPQLSETWEATAAALRSAGMSAAVTACQNARLNGCLPSEVSQLLTHWLAHPGAWPIGLLYSKIKTLRPDSRISWPEPSPQYVKKKAVAESKSRAHRAGPRISEEEFEKRKRIKFQIPTTTDSPNDSSQT